MADRDDTMEDVADNENIGVLSINRVEYDEFRQDMHRLQTARVVSYGILILLGIVIVGHYTVVAIAAVRADIDLDQVDHTFSIILPVISGLAGSAATYFFTEHKNP